jgi:hypothetical protein
LYSSLPISPSNQPAIEFFLDISFSPYRFEILLTWAKSHPH